MVENKLKKVCIDITPLQSEHRHRGIGSYVRELYKEHKEQDKTFEMVTSISSQGVILELQDNTIPYYKPTIPRYHFQWIWSSLLLKRKLEKDNINLIHSTDHQCIPQKGNYLRLFTVHDLIPLVFKQSYYDKKSPDEKIGYNLYLKALSQADHLIAISESTKKDLIEILNINENKITIIPNGVNIDHFEHKTNIENDRLIIKKHLGDLKDYFLYVGSAEDHKNINVLLNAFRVISKDNKDIHLCIIGKWAPNQVENLLDFLKENNLENKLHYLGYVSTTELQCLYKNCLSFVFPSSYEGFGLPILEAMACGAPIIMSDIPVFREISYSDSLFFKTNDTKKLVELMGLLIHNSEIREKHIRKGKEHVKKFTWKNTSSKTINLYENILKGID